MIKRLLVAICIVKTIETEFFTFPAENVHVNPESQMFFILFCANVISLMPDAKCFHHIVSLNRKMEQRL